MAAPGKPWRKRPGPRVRTGHKSADEKETEMFQMINDRSAQPRDRKMTMMKVGAFTVALLLLGATVYFFTFLPYAAD
jgi:hypothetical protein